MYTIRWVDRVVTNTVPTLWPDFDVSQEKWKRLVFRVENILAGQGTLWPLPPDLADVARRIADSITERRLNPPEPRQSRKLDVPYPAQPWNPRGPNDAHFQFARFATERVGFTEAFAGVGLSPEKANWVRDGWATVRDNLMDVNRAAALSGDSDNAERRGALLRLRFDQARKGFSPLGSSNPFKGLTGARPLLHGSSMAALVYLSNTGQKKDVVVGSNFRFLSKSSQVSPGTTLVGRLDRRASLSRGRTNPDNPGPSASGSLGVRLPNASNRRFGAGAGFRAAVVFLVGLDFLEPIF